MSAGPGAIALIGNGPISRAAAATIDGFDLVVRINHARLCGAAGQRTDVLVLPNRGKVAYNLSHGRPVNRRAARGAREIWFRNPVDRSNPRDVTDELLGGLVRGRPHRFFADSNFAGVYAALAAMAEPGETVAPSAGAQTLWYLLGAFPDRPIRLFGFTHTGWGGHSWDIEGRWMNRLVDEGRLSRAELAGPLAKELPAERVQAEVVRLLRSVGDRLRRRPPGPA